MTVFCLSMLNTIVMVQAAPTENGNATNTSDDRLAALTVSSSNNKDKDNDLVLETARAAIIPQSIVSAIVSLIDGFVLGFFPRLGRLKRTLAGLSIGAIIGALISAEALRGHEEEYDESKKLAIQIAPPVVEALSFGFLAFYYKKFGFAMIGALCGFIVMASILALIPASSTGVFVDPDFRIVFLMFFPLFIAGLVAKHGRRMVIAATAFSGSFIMLLGVDYFAGTKFAVAFARFFGSDSIPYTVETKTYIMLGILALLTIICMVVQFRFGRKDDYDSDDDNSSSSS
jgi:hypothetical protein